MYADNHQMHISGKDMHTIENTLNTEAQVASSWYKNNFLQANHDKFHILAINPRQHNTSENKNDTTLCIDSHEIPSKEHIKLLGVYLDENLNFNKQISGSFVQTKKSNPMPSQTTVVHDFHTTLSNVLPYCMAF